MEVTVTLDWDNASESQKAGWLVFVPLPDEFIDKIFRGLDAEQQQLCIEGQSWGADLIIKHWDCIVETGCVLQFLTYQKPPPMFVMSIWAELTTHQKAAAFGKYWGDCMYSISEDEFHTKVLEFVAVIDRWCEDEATNEELSISTLPELLTHSNQLVRAVAAGYIDGSIENSNGV